MMLTTARFAGSTYEPYGCEWEVVFDEVRDLDRFGANWDGEGAEAVRLDLIATAEQWLATCRDASMPPPGAVYPTVGGTIMLEWHLPDGTAIAAHVRVPGSVEVVFREKGQKPQFVLIPVGPEVDGTISGPDPSPYMGGGDYSLAA